MSVHAPPERSPTELRNDVRRGFVWLGTASAISRVLDILKVVVVLWCLSQEQLGEATLAYSLSVVLEALSGLGIGQALVQADHVSERTITSAFWYTMLVASLLVLSVCAGAHPLALMLGRDALAPMIMASATKLWFVGAALVPLCLLNRALAFERLAVVSTLASLASGLVTCSLAFAGCGAWAPLLGHIAGGLATMTLACALHPYRPSADFHWLSLRQHAAFGLKLASSNVLVQSYRNIDYVLVGHFLGVAALGVYRVAFDLAMAPCLAVLQVVNRAAVPVYARLRHDRRELGRTFLFSLESLGRTLAPVATLIALLAAPALALFRGGEFSSAAPLVPWLCAAALLRCLDQTFPQLLAALHKPWLALADAVLSGVVVTGLIALMLRLFGDAYGALAAAWGWLLAYPLLNAALFTVTKRYVPLSMKDVLRSQRHTVGSVLAMVAAHQLVFALVGRASTQGVQIVVGLLASGSASLAYALALRLPRRAQARPGFVAQQNV